MTRRSHARPAAFDARQLTLPGLDDDAPGAAAEPAVAPNAAGLQRGPGSLPPAAPSVAPSTSTSPIVDPTVLTATRPALDPRSQLDQPSHQPSAAACHSAGASAIYAHPRAQREIVLGDVKVAYEFARARRRSIGMVVGTEGLSVRAPRWVSVAEVEAALQEKSAWIRAKLVEQHERSRRQEAARIVWQDGASFPFLGETVIVVLDTRVDGAQLRSDEHTLPGVTKLTLHVGLPHHAQGAQVRDIVQAWLQRQAHRIFVERCQHFAARLGVNMTRMSLSNAQTRWGSAGADGSIRLNWRLVHFSMSTIDYVVAHELAHLREMNHSPRFWDVVRSVIPDPQQERGRLRDDHLPRFD